LLSWRFTRRIHGLIFQRSDERSNLAYEPDIEAPGCFALRDSITPLTQASISVDTQADDRP
jgi:hypothetical protein